MALRIPDNFRNDPRVRALGSRVGTGSAVGYIVNLWLVTAAQSPKMGRLNANSVRELEASIGWTGGDNALLADLIDTGWLQKADFGYQVLNWDKDQGHIWMLKQRNKKNISMRYSKSLDGTSGSTNGSTNGKASGRIGG